MTTHWLAIDPIDTLFFRGAESMEAGENHEVDTMFPPMPTTITGAIRTAILRQRGIAPKEYLDRPTAWQDKYPLLGTPEEPGFQLIGPLFLVGEECLLLPAPAHWHADLPGNWMDKECATHQVQAASPLAGNPLGLCGSVADPFWLRRPTGADMQPLSGYWATREAFAAMKNGVARLTFRKDPAKLQTDEAAILPASALFVREERVGIALTPERTAKEGHLYSAVHVRLRPGVRLAVGLASGHDLCLDREGIMQLGGEQRVCRYRLLDRLDLPHAEGGHLLLALNPVLLDTLPDSLASRPRASGKLLRVGGWDMQKRFHKAMAAWLPAGTIIDTDGADDAAPHYLTL